MVSIDRHLKNNNFCHQIGFAHKKLHHCLQTPNWSIGQWFSNLSWRTPCPAHFVCLPNQTPNLVLAVSSNELMSGIRCVRWRRHIKCAGQGVLLDRFENPCYRFCGMYIPLEQGWGMLILEGRLSLQSLAPTLIKHTWTNYQSLQDAVRYFFFQGWS